MMMKFEAEEHDLDARIRVDGHQILPIIGHAPVSDNFVFPQTPLLLQMHGVGLCFHSQ